MILVTGNGILAKELVKLSTEDLSIVSLSRQEMDITDEFKVSEVIKKHMMLPDYPKYLIHTAALTKPMKINDTNPMESIAVNIIGTANVAKVCHKYDIKFVYVSTDFVYDSVKLNVDENSPLKPSNKYGWSKLGGECVTQLISNSLILRCALCDIPFRHKVAFDDVYRSSITHEDVAEIIMKVKDEVGIINIGHGVQSVYDFVSNYQSVEKKSGKDIAPSLNLITKKLQNLMK